MANMSYCMFQNTLGDLRQCRYAMEEAETMSDMDLSTDERRAFEAMREEMQNMLSMMDELDAAEEMEEEF